MMHGQKNIKFKYCFLISARTLQ